MRIRNVIICVLCSLSIIGCAKEKTFTEKADQSIENIDGALHFATADVFHETVKQLASGEITLADFESTYRFKSLSSYVDEAFDALSDIDTEDLWRSCFAFYSDVVVTDNEGIVFPKIPSRAHSNICNREGVYYVGDVRYQITPDELIATSVSPETKAETSVSLEYIAKDPETKVTVTESIKPVSERYMTSDRQVIGEASIIRITTYNGSTSTARLRLDFYVEIYASGQKKGLFGWNSYNTIFTLEKFCCTVPVTYNANINPVVLQLGGDFNNFIEEVSTHERSNWTWQYPLGSLTATPFDVMPSNFGRFSFRVLSRGTGDCGAFYVKGLYPPYAEIPACR